MNAKKKSGSSVVAIITIVFAVLVFTSCGGGSITFTPGGSNPPPAKSIQPNASMIYAGPHMFIPAYTIEGTAGAVAPNATVVYRDSNGVTTQGPAGADGSFSITNFPVAWNTLSGALIEVSQIAPGETQSDPVSIPNA